MNKFMYVGKPKELVVAGDIYDSKGISYLLANGYELADFIELTASEMEIMEAAFEKFHQMSANALDNKEMEKFAKKSGLRDTVIKIAKAHGKIVQ